MSISEISNSSLSTSLETMSFLTTSKYGKEWRESMEEKYSIPKKQEEMDLWKSNVQRMKQEIHEKIEEIREERKKDTKILLNCFLEKELFTKHMNEIFQRFTKTDKKSMRRKRRFDEMES